MNKFSYTCFHVLCNICAGIIDALEIVCKAHIQIRRLRKVKINIQTEGEKYGKNVRQRTIS